jgi:hypothetical protein
LGYRNQKLACPFDEALLVYGLEASEALDVLRDRTFGLLAAIEAGVEKQRDRRNSHKRGRSQNPEAQTRMPESVKDHVGLPRRKARREGGPIL